MNKRTPKLLILFILIASSFIIAGCSKEPADDPSNATLVFNTPGASANIGTDKPTEPTPEPIPDFEAPKLYGVVDKQFYVGEGISYLDGIMAEDDIDEDVEITVDRSKVDTRTPGEYEVTYTATDNAGNATSLTAKISLVEVKVTEEEIDALAQEVLDEILTDDMSQVEKMWAIYKYVNSSMTYDGTSNKTDWRVEAKRGFTSGYGDCFTYYSMSDILLEKIGVEKMKVNRVGGQSKHYWHMVNVDGNWYHFDPCYRRNSEGRWNAFLRTDAEVAAFAAKVGIPNYEYYTYDKTKYPAVSTVEFEWDRDSYREK